MKKKISVGLAVILMLLVAVVTFQLTGLYWSGVYKQGIYEAYEDMEAYQKLLEVDDLFRSLYVEEIDETTLMDGILQGYVYGSGDKYAAYYPAEEFRSYKESLQGDMQGVGIHVIYNAEYNAIEIVNVMSDSPALLAGVEPGDMVIYVGIGDSAESVAELGYYGALSKLQGKAGTMAEFTVARGKNYSETVDFSIERGYVTEQTVLSRVYALDPTVGVIKITSFDMKTPEQFFGAVESLRSAGCDKLVLDVRYNPGGELTSICEVLDYLLPEGPVIRTIDKSGTEETIYTSDKKELNMPMAVIVNGSTASAGELFCSALKDYGKATIVGTKTYGKGCMQTIHQLSDGSGLSVTYSYYCPPFSDNYDGIGVEPHIVVEPDEALASKNIYKITDEEDNQLHRAVEAVIASANK